MSGLARGGHAPVLITFMMGTSAIIIGLTIDSLNGLTHLFGILCWMISAFFVNFWRDPDRVIPSDEGILVSPADGHVMFARSCFRYPKASNHVSNRRPEDSFCRYRR